jgi:hypothetical protein
MPRAVKLTDYSIFKTKVMVPNAGALPKLQITFLDGNGHETNPEEFDVNPSKNDGNFYTYSQNFETLWSQINPPVDNSIIKYVRIYMLAGQSAFTLDTLEVFNSKTVPEAPNNLSASITSQGKIALHWNDNSSATSFNLYRSSSLADNFVKIMSGIKTHEVPFIITPVEPLNYYKVTGVNSSGESIVSDEVEVIADITGIEHTELSPVSVYPNPCNGRFFIQARGETIKTLKIFNTSGQQQSFDVLQDETLLIIDMKTKKTGNYFIIIQEEAKTRIVKVAIR